MKVNKETCALKSHINSSTIKKNGELPNLIYIRMLLIHIKKKWKFYHCHLRKWCIENVKLNICLFHIA